MNKQIVFLGLCLLFCGNMAQLNGQEISKNQNERMRGQVDSVFQEMLVFAEKLDFNAINSGVDDARETGFITNGNYYSRFSDLMEDMKSNAQGISHQDIALTEKKTTVLSDHIVLLTASGVSKAYMNDGRAFSASFHWSFVYEKLDAGWKVIFSHQSIVK